MTEYYGLQTVLDPNNIKITQSDLAAFKRDRRVWFLKTYLGIRPKQEKTSGPLVLGTMVHTALEGRYRYGQDLLEAYDAAVQETHDAYILTEPYFSEHEWNKQAELGRIMLEGYEEWLDTEHIDSDISTFAVEKLLQVETTYHGIPVTLSGKADHIVRNNLTGELLVYDWKTTNNLERMTRQAHTTDQLPYYMTLQQALEPDEYVAGAAFTMLLKTKRSDRARPPFYRREPVRFTPEALENRQAGIGGAISDYVRVVAQLHDGAANPLRLAYANPGVMSFDRDLDPLIDIMDNGGNVPGVIAALYKQVNPYERYAEKTTSMLDDM